MRLLLVLLVAGSAFGFSNAEDLPSLEGAKVYRLIPDSDEKLSAVLAHNGKEGYDFLRRGHVLGDEIRVLVTADFTEGFESELTEYEIDYVIVTENAQAVIDEEKTTRQNAAASITRLNGRISFEAYPRYDTIVEYLEGLATNYSGIASLVNIGTSYEGRSIYGLKISSGGTGKPAILIDSALHAREWITPPTALYIINQLVENSDNADLYANVDWYIFPVLNPDGYEFTHTSYRLWRKTRSINDGSSCVGVDPNRNFGYYWMLNGASDLPCSEVFAGPEPFSEVETQALRDFVLANNETLKLYLAVHSYGNYFLYPWGYTSELPDNEEELRTLAEAADDALSTLRGTRYTIGTSTNVLYEAAGGSDDWVKGVGGVELSYTLELPGGGIWGFDPPVSEILPVGQETFLAIRVFGEYIESKFGSSKIHPESDTSKMQLLFLLLAVGAAVAVPVEEQAPSLEGAKVYRLIADTDEKLSALLAYDGHEGYDILKAGHALGDEIHLLVTADNVEAFETILDENEIDNMVMTENVQAAVDEEATRQSTASTARLDGRISFEAYQRYGDIADYLAGIAESYSDVASLVEIGTSFEGLSIYGLKISSGGTGKPAILIDGGIHAREWAAPATVTYIINQLIEEATNSDLFENVDWYIFPVLNPDGYEYTHTTYRLWRKTRSSITGNLCRGTDPNRNFGYYWMLTGASSASCSDTYAGPEAFSELETQALRDFVLANNDTIKLYLTFHSYGNYFLYPWGYTSELPDNEEELRTLAEAADEALSTLRGTRYTIGTSTNVLYAAAGGSDDWVKGVAGVELAYTLELPGGGNFGFDLPASEIVLVGQETFLAIRVFGEYIENKFVSSK
nr:uncharacterized protein LOC124212306 [Neodiprion pinetum]